MQLSRTCAILGVAVALAAATTVGSAQQAGTGSADLAVTAFSGPDVAAPGASIAISDAITNAGAAAAGPFVEGYDLSTDATVTREDVLLGTRTVSGLASGAVSSATVQLQLPLDLSGTYFLAAIVDPELQVPETDETNNTSAAVQVTADAAPPRVTITGVADGAFTAALPLRVCYTATDPHLSSDEGALDGLPFRGCAVASSAGAHALTVMATDLAGNVTTAQVSFTIDTTAPSVTVLSPQPGAFLATDTVLVVASISDAWGIEEAWADGVPLTADPDGVYTGVVRLIPDTANVLVSARDLAGNTGWTLVPVGGAAPPSRPLTLTVTTPSPGFTTEAPLIAVWTRAEGGTPPITVTVNGVAASPAWDTQFQTILRAPVGPVNAVVTAMDATGVSTTQSIWGWRADARVPPQGVPGSAGSLPRGVTVYLHDPAGNLSSVVDTSADLGNCGYVGTRCPEVTSAETACVNGLCGAIVEGQFVDITTDPAHCGTALVVCSAPLLGVASCVEGACGVVCDQSFARKGLACVDTLTDPNNCGQVDHVCPGAGGACRMGMCFIPGTPEVARVDGVFAPWVAFRVPLWSGFRLEGTHLDSVTSVELEDWGPDTAADGEIAAPQYRGTVSLGSREDWSGTPRPIPIPYRSSPTALVIPHAALDYIRSAWSWPSFNVRRWYKLRLHHDENGIDQSTLVDVPVSFDQVLPAAQAVPAITGVSAVESRVSFSRYDPATGFIQLRFTDPSSTASCGEDPTLRPPIAVLAFQDPLHAEYRVRAWTHEGIYLEPGLDPERVHRLIQGEAVETALVFPDEPGDFVNLMTPEDPGLSPRVSCWPGHGPEQIGGLILRGSNLLADGYAFLSSPPGTPVPGDLGMPRYLEDRIVIRPDDYPYFYEDWLPITGVENATAHVEYVSPRGEAVSRAVTLLLPPVITAIGPAEYVTYDQVMTITGQFFANVTDVAFTWGGIQEHLTPAPSAPPGPGQYFVVDDTRIDLQLSSTGGRVPRELSSVCLAGGPYVDVFPGQRGFTVENAVASVSALTNALDPAGTPVAAPPIPWCSGPQPSSSSSQTTTGPPPPTGPPTPIQNPRGPGSADCSNTLCP